MMSGSQLADYLRKHYLSTGTVRKMFNTIGNPVVFSLFINGIYIKHLMTGPSETVNFVSLESQCLDSGNTEILWKQN